MIYHYMLNEIKFNNASFNTELLLKTALNVQNPSFDIIRTHIKNAKKLITEAGRRGKDY